MRDLFVHLKRRNRRRLALLRAKIAKAFAEKRGDMRANQLFMVCLALLVGVSSGIGAVMLKHSIAWVKGLVMDGFLQYNYNLLLLLTPAIGILISLLLVKYLVRDNLGHGITKILYAISQKGSSIKPHNSWSSILTSSFTIGFGGSVGAEAPIALTGAAIGSNIGKFFKLDYKSVTLLMACGAAGGIAGVFKAPIAGMVFTLEILMLNLTLASIVPLLVSAITATTVTYYFLGSEVEFIYESKGVLSLTSLPFYILLGGLTGAVALTFTRSLWFFERQISRVRNTYLKWVVGSAALGLLIFFFPPLYGEGYGTINSLLAGRVSDIMAGSPLREFGDSAWCLLLFSLGILIFKPFATAATTGAGGVGGTFAPSLFLGGVGGFFFACLIHLLGIADLPVAAFTLVGMAGVMSGVMHAPLTSIFLIAEITNGYGLLLPLMIVSTVSHLVTSYFEPQSIYTKPLADKGELLTHKRDKAVLTLMHVKEVIETDFLPVRSDETLGQLVKVISKSNRNLFPVLNVRGDLVGVVLLDDIRSLMFDQSRYETTLVRDLMTIPPAFVQCDEPMETVMGKFDRTQAWNLPVVNGRRYEGFVSKSKIFMVYRNVLSDASYE